MENDNQRKKKDTMNPGEVPTHMPHEHQKKKGREKRSEAQ